jgi:hypothetical protein
VSVLPGNRRFAVAVGVLVAAILAMALLLARGCGEDAAPVDTAVRLVPQEALVYLHLSTDGDRGAVERAGELAERFDAYEPQRDRLLRRLSGADRPVDFGRDIEPWLGDEAAFALLDSGQATAGSLVLLEVEDRAAAERFLARNPRDGVVQEYKGTRTVRYGQLATAFVGRFLAIGQTPTVNAAIDRSREFGDSLDEQAVYRRATDQLAAGRVGHAYATADGLRRLLVPQGDVVGTAAALFDQPALQGVALSLQPEDEGLRVVAHSALDRRLRTGAGAPLRPFAPALADDVPASALGYLGARGLSGAISRAFAAAVGSSGQQGIGQALVNLRTRLQQAAGQSLERDLLRLLRGEVALVITRSASVPSVSLVAQAEDEDRTAATLRRIEQPLARALTPRGEQAPRWVVEGGVRTLRLPGGAGISYQVRDGKLVLSTSPEGLRAVAGADEPLAESDTFETVLADLPDEVGSLGFLDFNQLLELGEQTGLSQNQAYLAARDDLRRVRAVGIRSTGGEEETTAEIFLSIP